jgi:hypothetical protein
MKLDPPIHTVDLTTPDKLDFGNAAFSFKPGSRCIYCGDATGKRGDEHIIPYALAKNSLVFPEASCRKCEAITGRYEQAVLRRMMGNIRLRFDAPTRNKKNRKPTLVLNKAKVNFSSSGEASIGVPLSSVEIPASSAPMFYIGFLLDQPGILLGLPLGTPLEWKTFYTYKIGDLAENHANREEGVEIGQFNPYLCAQFLAKVAYSYAVAKLGDGAFSPLILDLVLGKTYYFRHWVGGELEIPPANEHEIHKIDLAIRSVGNRKLVIVRIRLFSFLGTPIYDVVVGECP